MAEAEARSGGASSINVLMVNNPQMLALQKHIGDFEKESGIKVNFTVKPENDMRNQAAQEFANQSGQFDVATSVELRNPVVLQEQLAVVHWMTSRRTRTTRISTRPTSSRR